MNAENATGIVIRQANWSETSKVVTWFTRQFGKVATVAKGAKRLKSPFEAAIDLLAICEVVILRKSSGGLDILTEARLVKRFTPAASEITGLYGGYYVAELLDSLCEPDAPHPELFVAAVTALEGLAAGADVVLMLSWFELQLLRELGHLPSFDDCALCGCPVDPKQSRKIQPGRGVVCDACQTSSASTRHISSATWAALAQLSNEEETTWQRLVLTSRQSKELRTVLTPLVLSLLGKPPRTLRYLPL